MQLPYSGLKIVHEVQVQEALERQRYSSEETRSREGLFQALGNMLGRFPRQSHRATTVVAGGCAARSACADSLSPF